MTEHPPHAARSAIGDVYPPGDHLASLLGRLEMTPAGLAETIGVGVHVVRGILDCTTVLTPRLSRAIEEATGSSAEVWGNLQRAYGEHLDAHSSARRPAPAEEPRHQPATPAGRAAVAAV